MHLLSTFEPFKAQYLSSKAAEDMMNIPLTLLIRYDYALLKGEVKRL
jgi:hypothetical protein